MAVRQQHLPKYDRWELQACRGLACVVSRLTLGRANKGNFTSDTMIHATYATIDS